MHSTRLEAIDILENAKALVEAGWSKTHFYVEKPNMYDDDRGPEYSAHGAVHREVYRRNPFGCAAGVLAFKAMWSVTGSWLPELNATSTKEVLACFDRAVEWVKSKEDKELE